MGMMSQKKRAQNVSEYAILLGVVMAVVLASQEMVKRSLMGKIKEGGIVAKDYSEDFKADTLASYKQAFNRDFFVTDYSATEEPERWEPMIQTDSNMMAKTKIKEDFTATYTTRSDTNTVDRKDKR